MYKVIHEYMNEAYPLRGQIDAIGTHFGALYTCIYMYIYICMYVREKERASEREQKTCKTYVPWVCLDR